MSCLLGLFFWFPIILSSTSNKKRNINISIVQKEKKKCTWGSRHDASQVPSPAVAANVDDGGGNGGVDVGSCCLVEGKRKWEEPKTPEPRRATA